MPTPLDVKTLSLAVAQTLQMWVHEKYKPFLQSAQPGRFTDEWFAWFLGQWGVARTIQRDAQMQVCRYIDVEFRKAVLQQDWLYAVDNAAAHLREQQWSIRGRLPLSLVSKIGFFLSPSKFVPRDSYGLKGLNTMRQRDKKARIQTQTYYAYLQSFNEEFAAVESQISAEIEDKWVATFADRLGCPSGILKTGALLRKTFDNYLMRTGGYAPSW